MRTSAVRSSALFILFLLPSLFSAQNKQFEWARQFGVTGLTEANKVSYDSEENVFIGGYFQQTADFDPGPDTANLVSAGTFGSQGDAFVVKLDSAGDFIWVIQFAADERMEVMDITHDKQDNFYVCGYFNGTADFDPGPGSFLITSTGSFEDAFVAKLNSAGSLLWVKRFASTSRSVAEAVAVDDNGEVYLTGAFEGLTDFDPGVALYNLNPVAKNDAFICKLNSGGNFQWARQHGGNDQDFGYDLVVDDTGYVYVTGEFRGVAIFQAGSSPVVLGTPFFGPHAFVSKFDQAGNFQWVKGLQTFPPKSGGVQSYAIALDDDRNILTSGRYSGTIDFDPGPDSAYSTANSFNAYINKLDQHGQFIWMREFTGLGDIVGQDLAVDDEGSVYNTGLFVGNTDFDPGPGTVSHTGSGADVYIVKLDSAGLFQWVHTHQGGPSSSTDIGRGIAVAPDGDIYTCGYFNHITQFDPPGYPLTAGIGSDAFLSKLSQQPPCSPYSTSQALSICQGDSAYLAGAWQDTGGVYLDSLLTPLGCDSVVTTTLNVISVANFNTSLTICSGDSAFLAGDWQHTSGTYYDSLTATNGCDSLVTTVLSVQPPAISNVSINICSGDSLFVEGGWQTTSGSYYDSLTNSNGCDSIVVTNLSVDPAYLENVVIALCPGDSLYVGGSWQHTAGNYYDTLTAVNGCDSIVITMLSFISSPSCLGLDSLSCVSDSSWLESTLVTPSNKQGFWGGVSSLPAAATFSTFATVGQPYPWGGLKLVAQSQPIISLENIRYFKKTFNLTNPAGYNARIQMYMDDGTEIYLNGHLLAREENMAGDNRKGKPHDMAIAGNSSVTNGYAGNDMFDMVLASVDLDTVLQVGMNEIVVVMRNPAGGHNVGGFSFRMDLNRLKIPAVKSELILAKSAADIAVFPNPSNGLLILNIGPGLPAIGNLTLFDLSGKEVYHHKFLAVDNIAVVELYHLPAGMYLLHLQAGQYTSSSKLIVK